ncbi:MAG: dihydrofolate reductase, partial [Microbacterium sp.]
GAETAPSLDEALALAGDGRVWVIGGGALFREAIARADLLEVTELDLAVDGDTFAPSRAGWAIVDDGEWQTSRTGIRYRFLRLEPAA